jgi:hypothetical protein
MKLKRTAVVIATFGLLGLAGAPAAHAETLAVGGEVGPSGDPCYEVYAAKVTYEGGRIQTIEGATYKQYRPVLDCI